MSQHTEEEMDQIRRLNFENHVLVFWDLLEKINKNGVTKNAEYWKFGLTPTLARRLVRHGILDCQISWSTILKAELTDKTKTFMKKVKQ